MGRDFFAGYCSHLAVFVIERDGLARLDFIQNMECVALLINAAWLQSPCIIRPASPSAELGRRSVGTSLSSCSLVISWRRLRMWCVHPPSYTVDGGFGAAFALQWTFRILTHPSGSTPHLLPIQLDEVAVSDDAGKPPFSVTELVASATCFETCVSIGPEARPRDAQATVRVRR